MNDTISLTLTDLSWNALLVGWRQGSLQLNDIRERAEAHITAAPDELLTPLSELASLDGSADRIEIEGALQMLAETESLQACLGQREWRAWDASQLQGHRKVDKAVIFLLTANSGGECLTMKSRLFASATADS